MKWLRLIMNHIPGKYEHLVRCYDYYSNRSRGVRKKAEQKVDVPLSIISNEPPVDARRKANWARLIQKVHEVGPLRIPQLRRHHTHHCTHR